MKLAWIIILGLVILAILIAVVASQTGGFLSTRTFSSIEVRNTDVEPINGGFARSTTELDEFSIIESFCLERKSGCEVGLTGDKPPSSRQGPNQGHGHESCDQVYTTCMEVTDFELANDAAHQLEVDAEVEEFFKLQQNQ